jgi:sugar O-acyltransferase (sialic acid O-acetyltransferase NeuD family)
MSANDPRPIVIFGTLRSASLARYCVDHDSTMRVAGFTVDQAYATAVGHEGLPLVPFEILESRFPPRDYRLLIPMGYQEMNSVRRERYEQALHRGYDFASYVSSRASVWPDLVIGDNVLIYEHAIVQPFCRIGNNCVIRSGANLGHHGELGDHAFIAAQVAIGGAVRVGEQSFVGLGAILRDQIAIGAGSFIGAGAVVIANTDPGGAYVGHPARKLERSALEVCGR